MSCAATLTEKVPVEGYVPERLVPVHISYTFQVPVPSPGMVENVNCLVAVLDDVLMMKT